MKLSSLLLLSSYRLTSAIPSYSRHHATASSLLSSFISPRLLKRQSIRNLNFFIRSTSALIPSSSINSATAATRFSTSINSSKGEVPAFNDYQPPIVSISDAYDSGNGELVSVEVVEEEPDVDVRVQVRIREDPYTHLESKTHYQYFSFRSTLHTSSPQLASLLLDNKNNKKQDTIRVQYIVENAGQASYANAFKGYSTYYTTKSPFDSNEWSRIETTYDEEKGWLVWNHDVNVNTSGSSAYFAYFPSYSYERHLRLVNKCAESTECKVHSLGQTLSKREIDCLTIGTGPKICWIIHRQHPGESMAEFFAEGLLTRLLGLDDNWDTLAQKAKELYTFKIVPNVNPDGAVNGYLRTNAAGSNLNREWAPSSAPGEALDGKEECKVPYDAPSLERSPEVYHILRHMDETGCDAFLDIHGDEDLPFNFLAGSQGMPNWSKRLEALHGAFLASYERANSDMQAKVSYEPDKPNQGLKNICSNQIALRFDCFSGTLEMPFKDLWKKEGWGTERARQLGASVLDPLCYIWPYLRDDKLFWEGLPAEDAYVLPSSKYE